MTTVTILRLDHRTFRDQRITSHVALTARALGANSFVYSGERDPSLEASINDVVSRWGGHFKVSYTDKIKSFIRQFKGTIIHLSMYGENHKETLADLETVDEDVLVIVGGAKVPPYVYELADFNTAVGWQPHSEVAAVGIFLHSLLGEDALYHQYTNAMMSLQGEGHKAKRSDRFAK